MASLEPVAAGFAISPTRARERQYLAFLSDRGDRSVPLEDALYDLRVTGHGEFVILLPFRSFEAAKRMRKAFEKASKDHQKAARERAGFELVDL